MPAVKRRYYILIFILVLIVFGLSARLHLAELVITEPLEHVGLTDVTADIKRLTLEQTYLSQLSFIMPTQTGQLTINAYEIAINYLPGKLVKGHVDTIDIDQITLSYRVVSQPAEKDDASSSEHQSIQPAEILAHLRAALTEYIPINKLVIKRIRLAGEIFAGLDGETLQLTSNYDAGTLYSELRLLPQTGNNASVAPLAASSQRIITWLSNDELKVELRPALASGELPANFNLALDETEINGSYRFSPRGLTSWLQPLFALKAIGCIDTVNGELSLNFQEQELFGSLSASSKHLSLSSSHAENISAQIRFNYMSGETSQDFKLLQGSYLAADKVSRDSISFADSRIDLAGKLNISEDNWAYEGTLNSKHLTVAYGAQQTLLADINAVINANADNLNANGGFSAAAVPGQFAFRLSHKLSNGAGTLSLSPVSAIDLTAEEHTISRLLTPWPYAFDLYTGKLSLSAQASWSVDEAFKLAGEIQLDDTGGNIGEIVFSGLSFDHKLEILPAIRSENDSQLQITTLDSGVAISDISMSLAATTSNRGPLPRFVVRDTQGKLLGGSFSADDMVYDLNRDNNRFRIKLKDIDLAEIVKTQQLEDIVASGRLNGSLPVEIQAQGIVIEHGGLVNDIHGGTIRYTPEAGTEQLRQNPLTGITLDALRDFRYSDLQADVNYQPDGKLTVALELNGISPELDTKRPVHLNINTEQNLISLLKSLRFAQGVSDSIDARVRRVYEQIHK